MCGILFDPHQCWTMTKGLLQLDGSHMLCLLTDLPDYSFLATIATDESKNFIEDLQLKS